MLWILAGELCTVVSLGPKCSGLVSWKMTGSRLWHLLPSPRPPVFSALLRPRREPLPSRCSTTPVQDHLSIFSSVLEPKALCIPRRPMMHSLPSVSFFLRHQRLSLGSAKAFCPARACVWFAFGVRQNNISMLPRDLKWLICLIFNFSLLVLLYN